MSKETRKPPVPHAGELAAFRDDISPIVYEFKNSDKFVHRKSLEGAASRLRTKLLGMGYSDVCDETSKFINVTHPLQLTLEWTKLVRRARMERDFIIVRRTQSNNAALLTQQKIEHLRNACSGSTPVLCFALAKNQQLAIVQGDVKSQEEIDEKLLNLAREGSSGGAVEDSMSDALFDAQQQSVSILLEELKFAAR